MANILTATEGSNVLRCAATDAEMLALLPLVDAYLKNASGRDWTLDATIRPEAKSAARMLLVKWHEDPGAMGSNGGALTFGLAAALVQLEALALKLESEGVPGEALALVASQPADGADEVATTANLVLIFNHSMAAGATAAVTLKETDGGASVAVANALDVTSKILTANPTPTLTADTAYTLVITAAADSYGQTLTQEIGFRTA